MIHCIGNSHVWLFNGESDENFPPTKQILSGFRTHHLGPIIAYNFMDHHLPKVLEILKNIPKTDSVMLIVGEVDCRWHLPFQAHQQNKSNEEIVKECLDRFFPALLMIKNLGYKVYGWGTHPTTTHDHMDPPGDGVTGPVFGNVENRNQICLLWNTYLKELCEKNDMEYISIYHHLVDENNITKMEYFRDYCHLSNKCLDLIKF